MKNQALKTGSLVAAALFLSATLVAAHGEHDGNFIVRSVVPDGAGSTT